MASIVHIDIIWYVLYLLLRSKFYCK